ncbi:VOC family protein [Bowmanella sp. Y26]|uniref:VOC family protein n=1 Tax=Bowmanella yangjiangensis TaxID=2811230 RepID=UPI001BDC8C48|nr:VOC family protein [Bowmanella yangjiangensis]MBT1062775.1 VOC family protein [Bowmanella yangjiangensis]
MSQDTPCSDVYPCLIYADAQSAINWLCEAFGFTCRFVVLGGSGEVIHCELSLGSTVIMLSSPKQEFNWISPQTAGGLPMMLSLYVADPDNHFQQAVAAGAEVVRELQDEEYGARGYMVKDPQGHMWYFGNYRPGQYWS